jgi:hypothetical protein
MKTFGIDLILKHCAESRRQLSALPNVGPYIYDVKISGFIKSSIYIYIYTHTYTHTYIYIYIHTHTQNIGKLRVKLIVFPPPCDKAVKKEPSLLCPRYSYSETMVLKWPIMVQTNSLSVGGHKDGHQEILAGE